MKIIYFAIETEIYWHLATLTEFSLGQQKFELTVPT